MVKRAAKMDVLMQNNKASYIVMFAKAFKRAQNRDRDMLTKGWDAFCDHSRSQKKCKLFIRFHFQNLDVKLTLPHVCK